ncbi:hypothetical protein ABZ801_13465 [Actinomadura sp. NPDC047616]|uniref:hypothetical protein n=1 Tax=Actinomadura sp. NPDC047616 TaxID=3155914 RepID=UPI003411334F
MIPPHCHVCGLDLRDVPDDRDLHSIFTLVYFALSPREQEIQDARDREGWTGTPPNAHWFCHRHVGLTRGRTTMHWRDALDSINAELKRTPQPPN